MCCVSGIGSEVYVWIIPDMCYVRFEGYTEHYNVYVIIYHSISHKSVCNMLPILECVNVFHFSLLLKD